MPTEALVAHVVVSKFADAQPLYRQVQILARQGVTLDRSTLANWVGRACWWLQPHCDLLVGTVLSSPEVFADDTTPPGAGTGAWAGNEVDRLSMPCSCGSTSL